MTRHAVILPFTAARLCRILSFQGFHVYGHMGVLSKPFFQLVLNGISVVMSLGESYIAAHKYMQLNGIAVAYAAGAQVMRLNYIGLRLGYLHYLILNIIG